MEFDSRVIATVTLFVAVTIGAIGMSVYGMRGASGTAHKKKSHSKQKVDKYKRPRSRSNSRTKHSVSDDSDADESMRGYKKTSTGKTTTYFNRELSEHESIILGDMTPRRIDASEVQSSSVSPAPTGGSVWNSAGTYEEKNITSWAQKRLNETVLNTVYCLPTDGMAMVMSVKSVEGDAAVSMIRGKKRYLYDMSVNLTWKLDSNNATATGKMSITDISAECCHEVVVSDIQSSNPAGLTASVINKHIKSETNSLTQALSDSLQRFYQEMKSTF